MPKQILLVEDSVTMQKVVQIAFAKEDYQVTVVSSADEAMSRLKEARPDVVLVDAGLTGKNGYDLATAVRAESNGKDVPILLLTSNFNPYDEARGQRAGVTASLVKPFDTQSVIDRVNALVKGGPVAATSAPAAAAAPAKPAASPQAIAPPAAIQPPAAIAPPAAQAQPLGSPGLRPPSPVAKPKESASIAAVAAPPNPSVAPARSEAGSNEGARMPEPTRAAPSGGQSVGIPNQVPQMPRPSLIPRAAVPAPVLAVLEKIASRGAEYEAVARLSAEAISQIAWEVVPELAEIILRSEAEKAKERRA
jgi:CheY-like chemotaxis protein